MSKSTFDIEQPQQEPITKPMNPEALNWLNWFMTDARNLNDWCYQIFNSDVDLNNPRFIQIKKATELALTEIDSDIIKIKEFLASYDTDQEQISTKITKGEKNNE